MFGPRKRHMYTNNCCTKVRAVATNGHGSFRFGMHACLFSHDPTHPARILSLTSFRQISVYQFPTKQKNIYMIFQKNMLPVVSYMLRHQISDILFCLFHPFHRTVLFSHIATAPSQTNMDCVPQQTQPRSMLRVAFFGHPFCSSDKIFIQVI